MSDDVMTQDPREANLPRWARETMEELRRQILLRDRMASDANSRVGDLQQQVRDMQANDGPADSNIFIDREDPETGDIVEPLGLGTGQVWFKVGKERMYVGVDVDGHLGIHAHAPCAVIPRSASLVKIMLLNG